jgi:hypothetical protein
LCRSNINYEAITSEASRNIREKIYYWLNYFCIINYVKSHPGRGFGKENKRWPRFWFSAEKAAGAWELFFINNISSLPPPRRLHPEGRSCLPMPPVTSKTGETVSLCRSSAQERRKKKRRKQFLRRVFNLHLTRNIVICAAGGNQSGNLFALLKISSRLLESERDFRAQTRAARGTFINNRNLWRSRALCFAVEIIPLELAASASEAG